MSQCYAGETGGIGEKEVEAISSKAEQEAGAESLNPVEKAPDAPSESQDQGVLAESGNAVKTAVTDGLNAIGNLVSGNCITTELSIAFTSESLSLASYHSAYSSASLSVISNALKLVRLLEPQVWLEATKD